MTANNRREWGGARDRLAQTVQNLGFPDELGRQMAKQLGSPRAIYQMISYLENVKPKSVELVVDEMLAICSDTKAWKDKKTSEAANASYNEMLSRGFGEGGKEDSFL